MEYQYHEGKPWCPVRGGDPDLVAKGGDMPVECPEYCLGEQEVFVEERLIAGLIGPVVSKLAITCVEAEKPKVQNFETIKSLFRALKTQKNN